MNSYILIIVIIILLLVGTTFVLCNNDNNNNEELYEQADKRIWAYWHTELEDEPLRYIAQNIDYWRKKFEPLGWEIIIVTPSNLATYIPSDRIPSQFDDLSVQHKTDWYRLYLLETYGGVWLDITILYKDEHHLNDWYESCLERKAIGVYSMKLEGSTSHIPWIENWFIMAPHAHHPVINEWYAKFTNAIRIGNSSFIQSIREHPNKSVRSVLTDNPMHNYLFMCVCLQIIIRLDPRLIKKYLDLRPCEENMLYIQKKKTHWDPEKFVDVLKTEGRNLPCVKICGSDRLGIPPDFDLSAYYD